ncbi:MAG: alpha/beta hydrolase [Nanoarchaeota archaeon]
MLKPISLKNNQGLTLKSFVHIPRKYDTAVLFLHGFPGTMFGTAKRICTPLTKLEYLCMRFEFSGTNTSQGKFENKLMSQEVKEVKYAIDFLKKNFKFKRLILIGHSTGAIDAALYAYKDKRINKLILLGEVCHLNQAVKYDFNDQQVYDFWKKGHIVYKRKGSWVNNKRLKKAFYDEFFKLDLPGSLRKFHRPVLIAHGEKDAIPVSEPKELFRLIKQPKKLLIIKGADHGFKKRVHTQRLIKEIRKFIRK